MKPPRFLLGATLLFWGWQTDFLFVSALMAMVLESTHFLKPRWEFSDEDFSRIWTLCSLLLLAGTVYAFTTNDSASNLLSFLQDPNFFTQRRAGNSSAQSVASLMRWQPMIFFAFMAAGAFSAREGVPLRTVSLILQKRWKKARKLGLPLPPSSTVSVGYPYFGLCLFSASIQSNEGGSFFWGLCFLLAWALWPLRSRRYQLAAWAGCLALALTMGYYGQRGLGDLQQYIGGLNPTWFIRYGRRGFDPKQTATMIGQLGEAKLSSSIMIRLEALNDSKPPALLREASYRFFRRNNSWYSEPTRDRTQSSFETVSHLQTNDTVWVLQEEEKAAHGVANIACYLPGGSGLLPLPRGTARLEDLPAFIVQKNDFGAVLASGPGLVIFNAFFGPGATLDSSPEEADVIEVPSRERGVLEDIVSELKLRERSLPEAMGAINKFFQSNFNYSAWQGYPRPGATNLSAIARFLTETRSGHCEYFATASVLLLRQLGIPARYAVGYAVHEKVAENKFVVRQRDAHAWALVWNGSRWLDFDTTPASWFGAEAQRASPFQAWSDFWSRVGFEFSKVRWGQSHIRQYLLWGLVPVLGLLLFQILFRKRRRRRVSVNKTGPTEPAWPGFDSEFYRLEKSLSGLGLVREPAESMASFVARAITHPSLLASHSSLHQACLLHYRYRFDPRGLTMEDRQSLRHLSTSSIQAFGVPINRWWDRILPKFRSKI